MEYRLGKLEDFLINIQNGSLYTVMDEGVVIAVYVISKECDEEYDKCKWEYDDATACVIHRLCVSPDIQNRGMGSQILNHIEQQLRDLGYGCVRLDVFTKNPHAVHLYEKSGYIKRGYADWRKGRFWLMEKKL